MRATDLVFLSGCTMLAFYSGDFSLSACLLKFVSLGISLCSDYANFTAKANAHCPEMHSLRQTHTCTHTQYIITFTELQMALPWKTSATVTNQPGSVSLWFVWYGINIQNQYTPYEHSHNLSSPSPLYEIMKPGCSNYTDVFLMRRLSFLAVGGHSHRMIWFIRKCL